MKRHILPMLFLILGAALPLWPLPAFPGAEGWGKDVSGGRGGQVVHVTNLQAYGTGSLAAALGTSGAKIIVFDVGGVIDLQNQILTMTSNTTVAGQTAPGGITLQNGGFYSLYQGNYTNMIIRFLRVRESADAPDGDCFRISHCSNYIVDHVSGMWNKDEVMDLVYSNTGTIQYSVIAEPGYCYEHWGSGSGNGNYCTNMLASSTDGRITLYKNIFAHAYKRSPFLSNIGATSATGKTYELVNNVFYNCTQGGIESFTDGNNIPLNLIGNYYKGGNNASYPSSAPWAHNGTSPPKMIAYVNGNYNAQYPGLTVAAAFFHSTTVLSFASAIIAPQMTTSISNVQDAFKEVVKSAGPQPRDSADRRIAREVVTGTGGWMTVCDRRADPLATAGGTRPTDSDNDGMPNAWETANGLNPNVKDNTTKMNGGYDAIEVYVNELADSLIAAAPPIAGTDLDIARMDGFALPLTAYPNPFRAGGDFSFTLDKAGAASLRLFDLQGRLVKTLATGALSVGNHRAAWNGRDRRGAEAPTGTYLVQLKSGNQVVSKKVTLVR